MPACGKSFKTPAAWKSRTTCPTISTPTRRSVTNKGRGKLVAIRIKKLAAGDDKGILFGCNPHSTFNDGKAEMMLGVIVLDDGK